MGVKELILNKGWAGRTLSRPETVERLNPLLRELTVLMHTWDAAASALGSEDAERIEASQRILRGDLGKLAETVYSCGGTAYTGVELDPGQFRVEGARPAIARALEEAEARFRRLLDDEKKVEHQMRTRAILENTSRNGSGRMRLARDLSHH